MSANIRAAIKLGGTAGAFFLVSLLLSSLLFFPYIDSYFASDDWPAILRNTTFSWRDLPHWFIGLRAGWYRPVHDLFIHVCWRLFNLDPVGYRIVSIGVYGLVAANVGLLAVLLTKDRRIGVGSVLFFTAFATHAEPVLLFAATNELLAGLFVLVSVNGYIMFRARKAWGWIVASGISALLAFASKETSLFFPLLLVIFDVGLFLEGEPKRKKWSFLMLPWLHIFLWLGFLLFRIPMGSSYSSEISISLLGLAKNFIYYILIGFFALPNNYAFFDSLPLWRSAPLFPLTALFLSTLTFATLCYVWWFKRVWVNRLYQRSLIFYVAWFLLALGPVIFVVTERAFFLSSIGIASALSILLVGAWDVLQDDRSWARWIILTISLLYLGLHMTVQTHRSGWFDRSGCLNQSVLRQLQEETADLDPGATVVLANLPDHTQFTFIFRATFPAATELWSLPLNVVPVLDSQLADKRPEEQLVYIKQIADDAGSDAVFFFRDGELVLQP